MTHALVIRGGNVVDGTGGAPFSADVAIDGGMITEIGKVGARGSEEIDADGLTVTPGFIDLHTHFDAQVCWDPDLAPVCWHGVTSVLMGNCGVTFAPCRAHDREFLAGMMETVEDIPREAILAGMPWTWEDYGGYLDALETLRPGVNVAGLIGHAALRYYVMGERSFAEPASADEVGQMAVMVDQAMQAGAKGFSTNRWVGHKAPDGRPIPGTYADRAELVQIGEVVARRGGLMQWVGASGAYMADVADATGAHMIYGHRVTSGTGKAAAAEIDKLCAGRSFTILSDAHSAGGIFGLQSPLPFRGRTWKSLQDLKLAERLRAINEPATAAKLVEEANSRGRTPLDNVFYLGDDKRPNFVQAPSQNLETLLAATGETFVEFFLRVSRETEGRALFQVRLYSPDIDELADFFQHSRVFPGFGDAGAHVSQAMNAGWPTFMLAYWVRERGAYSLSEAVRRLTSAAASVLGLHDRGVLSVGRRADINVFDPEAVCELQPQIVHDFPGGAPRFIERAEGYKATIVNGQVSVRDGELTGARAGSVLRHAT